MSRRTHLFAAAALAATPALAFADVVAAMPAPPPTDTSTPETTDAGVAAMFMVSSSSDAADANPGDGVCADATGVCTFRAAVQEANLADGEAHVELPAGTYRLTVRGGGEDAGLTGDLDITGKVVVMAAGAVLDLGALGDRGFDIAAGASLHVQGLTVFGGAPSSGESGGAFRSAGMLRLDGVDAHANQVWGPGASGGAIVNVGGELVVSGSTISMNKATRAGGAIEADAGMTTIVGSRLEGNWVGSAPGNGGAFHLTGAGTVIVDDSIVVGNVAAAEGGGLWNSAGGTMTVTGSDISGNGANGVDPDQGGGGLFNDGGTLVVENSTVSGNTASNGSGSGGGLFNNAGTLEVSSTTIEANRTARAGGGIEANAGTTILDDVTLRANRATHKPGNGGGLHLSGAGMVEVANSLVAGNVAGAEGGGLWNSAGGTMTITGTTIEFNGADGTDADQGGGGLFNDGGTMTVSGSVLSNNSAWNGSGSGGGVLNNGGNLEISGTEIVQNGSARAGGGVEANAGTVIRSTFDRNWTGPRPGSVVRCTSRAPGRSRSRTAWCAELRQQ
ncbi:MAG: right-handed parallel beta-helix repeat-containing protein [Ilumatobacteraceae bacterium]